MTTKSKKDAAQSEPPAQDVERSGARISADTRDALHAIRDHAMNTCGCDDCIGKLSAVHTDDEPGDKSNDLTPASVRKLVADIVRTEIAEALRAEISPMVSRVNALLTYDAQRDDDETSEITRRVDDVTKQLADIKEIVEKIAAQPADGGPVLHGGGPVDKFLATQAATRTHGGSDAEAIQRALELGFAPPTDPQEQIRAAAKLFKPIPR